MLKVLFVENPIKISTKNFYLANSTMTSLAASIAPHKGLVYEVLLDAALRKRSLLELIAEAVERYEIDLVALNGMACQFEATAHIARYLKFRHPSLPIVVGGWHVSGLLVEGTLDPRTLRNIDFAIYGEGEQALKALCDALEAGVTDFSTVPNLIVNRGRELQINPKAEYTSFDRLPPPAREAYLHPEQIYGRRFGLTVHGLETSRGCQYDCAFCCTKTINEHSYRTFPLERILADLEQLSWRGAKQILLTDENPLQDPAHFRRLLEEIISNKFNKFHFTIITSPRSLLQDLSLLPLLKEAGVRDFVLGVESFNRKNLAAYGKTWARPEMSIEVIDVLRRHGMYSSMSFIIGAPEDTREDLLFQFEHLQKANPDVPSVFFLTPFPGTRMRRTMLEAGLIKVFNYRYYTCLHPLADTHHLDRKSLVALRDRALRAFFLRPARFTPRFLAHRRGRFLSQSLVSSFFFTRWLQRYDEYRAVRWY
ncbi:MAG: hypothetical protein A2284_09505 [Deltaproteobacteria bacterium RIFOXYA12_FULL_61_11]|nr:MAG: hypothetical protein A2284_09505 [Deltaproteobacteria bacterium RIFOXYA12_FULL_61_11]